MRNRIRNFYAGPQLELDLEPPGELDGGGQEEQATTTDTRSEAAESRTAAPRGATMDSMGLTPGATATFGSELGEKPRCNWDLTTAEKPSPATGATATFGSELGEKPHCDWDLTTAKIFHLTGSRRLTEGEQFWPDLEQKPHSDYDLRGNKNILIPFPSLPLMGGRNASLAAIRQGPGRHSQRGRSHA